MYFGSLMILADENVSPRVVAFLREQKLDVLDTKEELWHGREDDQLLDVAYRQRRFVLTHDTNFGTLVRLRRALARDQWLGRAVSGLGPCHPGNRRHGFSQPGRPS